MSNDPTVNEVDNSDLDLSGTALRDPIINKQRVLCVVTDIYWEELRHKQQGPDGKYPKQLCIFVTTREDATSTDGQVVPSGTKVPKQTIYATPSGGLTQEMINKRVARFQNAVLGVTGKWGDNSQYIGKPVKAWLEAEADKQDPTIMYQRVSRWEKVS